MPDSASWTRKTEAGHFSLTHDTTSFTVVDTLDNALGSDTLGFQAWTLSIRTTTANCMADKDGNLYFLPTPQRDSLAIYLLLRLDSLRQVSATEWGTRQDNRSLQIEKLIKAYAQAILSGNSRFQEFPSLRPVGIDSSAVVETLLLLAAQQGFVVDSLATHTSLTADTLKDLIRRLYAAGTLTATDTITLFSSYQGNHAPFFSGASDITVALTPSSPTSVTGWITAISAGEGESGQKVRFEVLTESGSSTFDSLPKIDSTGTLRFLANSEGTGRFKVRAVDDGGHATSADVDSSAWKSFSITVAARSVLTITGVPDTLSLTEDSTTTISLTIQNLHGSVLSISFSSGDTSLIPAQTWSLTSSSTAFQLPIKGKADAFGKALSALRFSDSLDAISLATVISIAARNDAPTFRNKGSTVLALLASAHPVVDSHWIDSILPGPSNEASQAVTFEVELLGTAASNYAVPPQIGTTGALSFTARTNSSGKGNFRFRAKDDGGHALPGASDSSAWDTISVTFNVAPTLTLTDRKSTTYEAVAKSLGTLNLADPETSADNLAISWTVSDTALLPHDNIVLAGSGSNRTIQATPAAHKWGNAVIVFTVSDGQGGFAKDSLTLTVEAVNHAPIFSATMPNPVYSYKAAQTLGTVVWDDVSNSQKGRMEVTWNNVSDSALAQIFLVAGKVQILAKQDTLLTIPVRLRFVDSSGTAYSGVDTAWAELSIPLVDTVQDAEGNAYKVSVLGTQTWMRSNLRRTADIAACPSDSCEKYGRLYAWSQAFAIASFTLPLAQQGLCPDGWHIPTSLEWNALQSWSGDSSFYKLRSKDAWTDVTRHLGVPTMTSSKGTDRYGFSVLSTTTKATANSATGDEEQSMGTNLWTSSAATGSSTIPVYAYAFFAPNMHGTMQSTSTYTFDVASIRCIKDSTERGYSWLSP